MVNNIYKNVRLIKEELVDSGLGLSISWADGTQHEFHALWLRECSNDHEFRDPGTKMRIAQA